MKFYAWVLGIALVLTHLGYNKISALTGIPSYLIFYSAMGNLSAVLMVLIGIAVSPQKSTLWKLIVYLALGFGIAQGLMMNCILLGQPSGGIDVCDYHSGLPVGRVADWLSAFIACFLFGKGWKHESQRNR